MCCSSVRSSDGWPDVGEIIQIRPSFAIEFPQRLLYCDIVDLELLDFFLDSRKTELGSFILCASLILAMSEMLYLFRTGLQLVEPQCSGRSFEEMAKRGECLEVLGFATISLAPRTERAGLRSCCIHCCIHLLESALHLFEKAIHNALAEFSFFLIIIHF